MKNKPTFKLLLDLFLTFARIGAFTFGGGYAMISLIEDICVERKGWITHDEMMDATIIAESTPGPIAINCATYVGFKHGGLIGATAATFGMVMPSFVIIYIISLVLDHFMEVKIIASAFRGIRVAVGVLILNAAVTMFKKMKKKPLSLAILGGAFAAMLAINIFALKFSSIVLMIIAGVIGLVASLVSNRKGGEAK